MKKLLVLILIIVLYGLPKPIEGDIYSYSPSASIIQKGVNIDGGISNQNPKYKSEKIQKEVKVITSSRIKDSIQRGNRVEKSYISISNNEQSNTVSNNQQDYTMGSCAKWDKLIDKYAKNKTESTWAKRVMRCESSCNALVVNSLGYTGLFQWSPYYWSKQFNESIFDGEAQIKNSLWKYRQGGAGIWVCK